MSWQFANLQTGTFTDLIDVGKRANGSVVLRIRNSDGSEGILGLGCHGPGAPDGILEGVIATKGYVTYWNAQTPVGARTRTGRFFTLGVRVQIEPSLVPTVWQAADTRDYVLVDGSRD